MIKSWIDCEEGNHIECLTPQKQFAKRTDCEAQTDYQMLRNPEDLRLRLEWRM